MRKNINNITLIGFPRIGKGQIGKILAEKTGFKYIDTQQLLARDTNYKKIIDQYGFEKLLTLEANIFKKYLKHKNIIIVTGGSLAFSKKAMQEAKKFSTVVYLQDEYDHISKALKETPLAFLLKNKKKDLQEDLVNRDFLYCQAADFVVSIHRKDNDLQTNLIIKELQEKFKKFYQ